MSKDIEWLRHKLKHLGELDNHMLNQCEPSSGDELYFEGSLAATERALDFLDELEDLPVVPAWFHEWWKDVPRDAGSLFHNIDRFHDELFSSGTREMYNYIGSPDNKQKLLNIIINESGYKVEEEQEYYAKLKKIQPLEGEWLTNLSGPNYYALDTKGLMLGEFILDLVGIKTEASTHTLKDWERYGINDSNADFIEIGDD